jgi:chemotaxis protein methyltransferase CheR
MSVSMEAMNYVCDFVYKKSAIVLDTSKDYLIESRLSPIAREQGFGSVDELVVRLRAQRAGELHNKVVEAMTTNETTFFRDIHPFEALKNFILPNLMKDRAVSKKISIWSAASSTGQEPYSIAMLLLEHFPVLASWQVNIVGTDINQSVLEKARNGSYRQLEINRGLPAKLLTKYFDGNGLEWRIKDSVRSMVSFQELNLLDTWNFAEKFDIVFLRNVLIYFDMVTKKNILSRVRKVLQPDGCLFLGGAETTMNVDDAYERVQVSQAVFYRLYAKEGRP